MLLAPKENGEWREDADAYGNLRHSDDLTNEELKNATVEVREVKRRQLFVNGVRAGEDFE